MFLQSAVKLIRSERDYALDSYSVVKLNRNHIRLIYWKTYKFSVMLQAYQDSTKEKRRAQIAQGPPLFLWSLDMIVKTTNILKPVNSSLVWVSLNNLGSVFITQWLNLYYLSKQYRYQWYISEFMNFNHCKHMNFYSWFSV